MSLSGVHAQLGPILSNPMDCGPPGSSVHRILQARILEWVAISSSTGSSQLRDWNCFCIAGGSFTTMPPGKHFFTYRSFFIRCQLMWILFSWYWIFSQPYRILSFCSKTLVNYFEKDWAFGVLFLKTITWHQSNCEFKTNFAKLLSQNISEYCKYCTCKSGSGSLVSLFIYILACNKNNNFWFWFCFRLSGKQVDLWTTLVLK